MEEYNFPVSDYEAYQKYPKLNWVYNQTRLLTEQHIEWSPFPTDSLNTGIRPFTFDCVKCQFFSDVSVLGNGFIYVAPVHGDSVFTECVIVKGEVKWMAHYDDEYTINPDISGAIDLRISAFVTLFMSKFSGIVSFETIDNEIYGIKLRPTQELIDSYPTEALKLLKKLYKKPAVQSAQA
jgi:hypothetical protein